MLNDQHVIDNSGETSSDHPIAVRFPDGLVERSPQGELARTSKWRAKCPN